MKIEHKAVSLDIKALDEDSGTVELYAAVFGNVDRTKEVIEPGAFKNLDEFVKVGWLAVNHDWNTLGAATIEAATQDEKGLKLKAHFHSTAAAQDVRTVVRERHARGKAVKASIGYKVLEAVSEKRGNDPVRVLKAIELYEASIVNLPANPLAGVSGIKSTYDALDEAYLNLKAGRVISRSNRGRLSRLRDQVREALSDLDALLSETDVDSPDEPAPEPLPSHPATPKGATAPADVPDIMSLSFDFEATCARLDSL